MSLAKHIKENPFAAIGLLLTLSGVVLSIANYLILNSIQPLDNRIGAVEKDHAILVEQHEEQDRILDRFLVVESKVNEIDKKVDRIEKKLDSLFIPR